MDPSCFLATQFRSNSIEMRYNGAFQTEREYRYIQTDSMRKIMCFLNIKACKHVGVETQNTNMNLKMSIICPL